jgi:murein DD-endopeptidase MepM/ murein hydrolase activator NlpD
MNRLQALILVLLLAFIGVISLSVGRVSSPALVESIPAPPPSIVAQPTPVVTEPPAPVVQPSPSEPEPPSVAEPAPSPVAPTSFVGQLKLIIPVAGVRPDQLLDTFTASRSEGRTHDAIDIMAPAETPVFAAADGQVQKLSQSDRGGTTIYQFSADQKLIFYYAHLARYADGLTEGKQVRQGEVIAYVGDTGNAGAGNYHLHFSVAVVSDPKRYWEGANINPYPLLRE